jgi:hypothetical protein
VHHGILPVATHEESVTWILATNEESIITHLRSFNSRLQWDTEQSRTTSITYWCIGRCTSIPQSFCHWQKGKLSTLYTAIAIGLICVLDNMSVCTRIDLKKTKHAIHIGLTVMWWVQQHCSRVWYRREVTNYLNSKYSGCRIAVVCRYVTSCSILQQQPRLWTLEAAAVISSLSRWNRERAIRHVYIIISRVTFMPLIYMHA